MSGNKLRIVCVVLSALLFLAGLGFGVTAHDQGDVAKAQVLALISGSFLAAGSIVMIAAAITKPDN